MSGGWQREPASRPPAGPVPRFVLCRVCSDQGFVVVRRGVASGGAKVVITDACPDCAERAEEMWKWMRESRSVRQGRVA